MKNFFVFLWTSLCGLASANVIECQSRVQPHTLGIGQQGYLIITANQPIDNCRFSLPASDDLSFHYESQSSQITNINGSIKQTTSLYFRLVPQKQGHFIIPDFKGTCNKGDLLIKGCEFDVFDQKPSKNTSMYFVLAGNFPEKWYAGQCFPTQIQLLTPPNIRGQLTNYPQKLGDGFSASRLVETPQKTSLAFNGQDYVCIYWSTLITALKSGPNPLSFSVDMEVQKAAHTRELFDDDDDPLNLFAQGFGGMFARTEPVSLKTKLRTFQILPLPTPQPKSFCNAIGQFQISTPQVLEKESIQNEPLTFLIKVTGAGNFENITPPLLEFDTNQWRMYEPTSHFESKDQLGFEGTIEFKYTLVPLIHGKINLPNVTFCFFDPKSEQYEILERSSLEPIVVKPALHTKSSSIPVQNGTTEPAQPAKTFVPTICLDEPTWLDNTVFFVIQIVLACFTLLGLVLAYQHYQRLHNTHYRLKKEQKERLNLAYKAFYSTFKQRDGLGFYVAAHSLIELLLNVKNLTTHALPLSVEEQDLLHQIEQKYQESKFGQKQTDCPTNITPFKNLIRKLK